MIFVDYKRAYDRLKREMQWAEHAWQADGCLIKEIMTWILKEN